MDSHWYTAIIHQLVATMRGTVLHGRDHDEELRDRDRGAVSLEQVLWFVAAGVSVAVVAGLLWSQIRSQASTPVVPPSAP